MDDTRPSPDNLLRRLSHDEHQNGRGKLKIFFGYAAGVGKTYAMLQAAHEAKNAGADVVVGYVEPHTRPHTLALLEGLEQLPAAQIPYKGITLREFDIDAALKRHPSLILVDELAHTNAEGSRHLKRYQDVEELLKAGIDVYTTVNVQHIESINDIVESLTGIPVKERIPDRVFDDADRVELIDIEPDDLINRLGRGEVYKEAQAKKALKNFFTSENLIALRELSLRLAANRVNIVAMKSKTEAEGSPYIAGEHVLLCLSASPSNAKVVRTAARMAEAFHCPLTGIFAETSSFEYLSKEERGTLAKNMKLAEQLGAKIAVVYGDDVAQLVTDYAKAGNITKIVIGRPAKPYHWLSGPNLIDRLCALAPELEIFVIPNRHEKRTEKIRFKVEPPKFSAEDTLKSAAFLVLSTIIGFLFYKLNFDESNIITVYILGVLFTAVVTEGRLYSGISSVIAVLAFNYFFTEPRYSLETYNPGYPLTFLVMFISAFLTSTLTTRSKLQARVSSIKAHRMEVLLETSQKLQQAKNREEIYTEAAKQITKLLDRTVVLYPVTQATLGEPVVIETGYYPKEEFLTPNERAVAEWVYKNNKRAGAGTNTLAGAKCLYMAIRSGDTVFAVVGLSMIRYPKMDAFEQNLLIAILAECALAAERYSITP